jgi:hypothetical protein
MSRARSIAETEERATHPGGLGSAMAWFIFPIVPALLGQAYHQTCNLAIFERSGPDPWVWTWERWIVLTGPLLGYGFLAGATIDLSDDPGRRGIRSWCSRRAVWVGIGPWLGFVVGVALYYGALWGAGLIDRIRPGFSASAEHALDDWEGTWKGEVLRWTVIVALIGSLGYGWVFVAVSAVRRARRLGRARRAIKRGAATALAFVGSLFGSFWAITEAWRSYFFDPRVMPLLLASTILALASGCGTITYGEARRRELFSAMLMAWLLGLAFVWRWWSRKGPRP